MRIRYDVADTISSYSVLAQARGIADLCSGAWLDGTPAFLKAALAEVAREDCAGYAPPNGIDCLRDALARQYDPPDLVPGNVSVTPGTTGALLAALVAFAKTGDEVLFPVPSYGVTLNAVLMAGLRPRTVEAWGSPTRGTGWRLDVARIRAAITARTAALVVVDPDNPTGAILDKSTWDDLAGIARKFRISILADRTYERYWNEAQPVPTATLVQNGIAVASSFSKSFHAAGLRVGWLMTDSKFQDRIGHICATLFGGVPLSTQRAATIALTHMPRNYFLRERQRAIEAKNRLCALLIAQSLRSWPVEGGLFVNVPADGLTAGDGITAWQRLAEMGFGGVPSSAFYPGCRERTAFVRLSFARSERSMRRLMSTVYNFRGDQRKGRYNDDAQHVHGQ